MQNNPNISFFQGGFEGEWTVKSMMTITGEALEEVSKIAIGNSMQNENTIKWTLSGVSSHLRYTTRNEKNALDQTPSILGKTESTCAAFIPLKKSDEWWLLTQDERRKIFENQSKHIQFSIPYLNTISRKLHHSRDLGEPFDFLTWFEFSPVNQQLFDDLVGYLRTTEEWNYVVRDIDIRLIRNK